MSDDFMNGMFDFNGDGKTDLGEEFIAYNIYEDMTKNNSENSSIPTIRPAVKKSGIKLWHIILIIILIIYEISTLTNPYNRSGSIGSYNSRKASSSSYSYSSSKTSSYSSSSAALTKEEADALRGTGYHNTRPNSSAENMELAAAQVKCKRCGKHSTNGLNSMCNSCRKITGGY